MTEGTTENSVKRYKALFQSYTQKHVQFQAGSCRTKDGKSEGSYSVIEGPIDIAAHLTGSYQSYAGIPLLDDGLSCNFGAIDIDEIGIDLNKLARNTHQLPVCVCESKSLGAHLYLFVDEPIPAALMQRVLGEWAIAIGHPDAEIFPKQTERKKDQTGNAINLPYYGDTRHMVGLDGLQLSLERFLDEAEKRIVNQAYLETVRVSTAGESINVSGSYAGRNNYLNALGYKMIMLGKTIEEVETFLHQVNENSDVGAHANFAEGPLPENEVDAILKSLSHVQTTTSHLFKEYAIIQVMNKVRIGRKTFDPEHKRYVWHLLSESDFHLRERKSKEAKDWLRSDAPVFDGFTFDPTAGPVVNKHINLWEGWAVDPAPGDWSKFKAHCPSSYKMEHVAA
jgi:hypothetical protein